MQRLKKFEEYNESIGWSDQTVKSVESTIKDLYSKIGTLRSRVSSFLSHGKPDTLENEENYISYLDNNFNEINWKDENTARVYIDTAKDALLADRDPQVIRTVCSNIYHLINL